MFRANIFKANNNIKIIRYILRSILRAKNIRIFKYILFKNILRARSIRTLIATAKDIIYRNY